MGNPDIVEGPLWLCCTRWSLSALRVHAAACPPGRCHRCVIDIFSLWKHKCPFTGGRKSNFLLGVNEKAGHLSYCVAFPLASGTWVELVWAVSSAVSSLSLVALCGSCSQGVGGRNFARERDVFSVPLRLC